VLIKSQLIQDLNLIKPKLNGRKMFLNGEV